MEKTEYRPKVIEFDVEHDKSIMPETLGEFKTAEEAAKFIGGNITSINQSIKVNRFLDQFEKKEIRNEYNDILENKLPALEKDLSRANSVLAEAKKNASNANGMVKAAENQAKMLALEVKGGVKGINLDEKYTFKVPFKGKHYFYTYMDKQLKMCKIRDIPEHEKTEIWNAMAGNEEFIEKNYGEAETQKRKKK